MAADLMGIPTRFAVLCYKWQRVLWVSIPLCLALIATPVVAREQVFDCAVDHVFSTGAHFTTNLEGHRIRLRFDPRRLGATVRDSLTERLFGAGAPATMNKHSDNMVVFDWETPGTYFARPSKSRFMKLELRLRPVSQDFKWTITDSLLKVFIASGKCVRVS